MIVHNITIKVDLTIEEEWKHWQVHEQLPQVMSTSLFSEYKFYKLLEQYEEEASTYIIQLFANTAAQLDEYLQHHAPRISEKARQKWGNRYIAFSTSMETVK
jgi:hypothetical protein